MTHSHKLSLPNITSCKFSENFRLCPLILFSDPTYLFLIFGLTPQRVKLFEKLGSLTKELEVTKFLLKFDREKGRDYSEGVLYIMTNYY